MHAIRRKLQPGLFYSRVYKEVLNALTNVDKGIDLAIADKEPQCRDWLPQAFNFGKFQKNSYN